MKVLNYGSLNIDITFEVPHIVVEGETLASSGMRKGSGGKGANQSAALGKAGVEVFHAGKIGKDGEFLVKELESYGVDTELVSYYDGPSGQAIIQVDDEGRNSIILLGGGNREIKKEEVDSVLKNFSKGDYLVLQNEINNLEYIINKAYSIGMKILFNPAPFDPSILSLPLDKISILVVNEIEGQGLAGIKSDDYEKIITAIKEKHPNSEIILTVGEKGSYYLDKELIHEDALPVKVVDTTGAGDTFIGYFLASRIKGLDARESLKKATKASSIAVSRSGAMKAIPTEKEVF
ncbi:MAG: ribokinase [Sphaerochaetaceae bacterium]|nr:ribokinase [Sphaerochaetaceae bacterium]